MTGQLIGQVLLRKYSTVGGGQVAVAPLSLQAKERAVQMSLQVKLPLLSANDAAKFVLAVDSSRVIFRERSAQSKVGFLWQDLRRDLKLLKARYRTTRSANRAPLRRSLAFSGLPLSQLRVLQLLPDLGRDTLEAAALGCQVTSLYNNPILEALAQDALHRAKLSKDRSLVEIATRIRVVAADPLLYISTWTNKQESQQLEPRSEPSVQEESRPHVVLLNLSRPLSGPQRYQVNMAYYLSQVVDYEALQDQTDSLVEAAQLYATHSVIIKLNRHQRQAYQVLARQTKYTTFISATHTWIVFPSTQLLKQDGDAQRQNQSGNTKSSTI